MTRLGLEQAALVVLLAVLSVVEGLHHLAVLLGDKLTGHPVMIQIQIKCLSCFRSRPEREEEGKIPILFSCVTQVLFRILSEVLGRNIVLHSWTLWMTWRPPQTPA